MAGPSDPQAAIAQGLAALHAREHQRAAQLLHEAALQVPEAQFPWMALGNAEMALGNLDEAEVAIDRQLKLAFRDVGALLLKGLLREKQGDSRAAISFYQAAINQAGLTGSPPPLADLLAHAGRFIAGTQDDYAAHLQSVVGDNLSPTMREAMDLLSGKAQVQLQQPRMFYYPGLPQKYFYETNQFPWLEPMLELAPRMAEELEGLNGAGFAPYVTADGTRPAPNNPLLNDIAWSALYFWKDGAEVAANAAACPSVMEALAHSPMPYIVSRSPNALFSRLLPGAHITPHHGMLNTRLICHIPVKPAADCTLRVGNETREWQAGKALVFDDSVEHEARNAGNQERVILLFEIWRPEIPEEDRLVLSRIFQAIDAFGVN